MAFRRAQQPHITIETFPSFYMIFFSTRISSGVGHGRALAPTRTAPRSRGDDLRELALGALRSPMARALTTPLLTPRSLDDYLALLGPMWSLSEVRARLVGIVRETPDVTSLLLVPTGNWRPHTAGQHVLLTVDIDGVRHTRSFSLSRAANRGSQLRVTIKAHPGGRVSVWARDRAKVGDVVALSQPQGYFVLPDPTPGKLLFVSGGSGITPLLSMAQQLTQQRYVGDLHWIHSERDEIPLESELRAVEGTIERASLHVHRNPQRRLTPEQIASWVPDWAEREAFVCGPRGLMELVESRYREQGRAAQVHSEDYQPRFAPAPRIPQHAGDGQLFFARTRREASARPGVSLLAQAEQAGLHPPHGCRRGICHTCKCRKLAGRVRNELTGETNDEKNQEIQLCIHSPIGNVSLDL